MISPGSLLIVVNNNLAGAFVTTFAPASSKETNVNRNSKHLLGVSVFLLIIFPTVLLFPAGKVWKSAGPQPLTLTARRGGDRNGRTDGFDPSYWIKGMEEGDSGWVPILQTGCSRKGCYVIETANVFARPQNGLETFQVTKRNGKLCADFSRERMRDLPNDQDLHRLIRLYPL